MKPAFIAAIVLAATVHFAPRSQAEQRPTHVTTGAYHEHPDTLTAVFSFTSAAEQQAAKADDQAATRQAPSRYEAPEWALPLIGVITFLVIAWQSFETRRAASATQKSVAALEGQTAVLRDSVAAAQASADAAMETIGILKSKERARVRVTVGQWVPEAGKVNMFRYTIHLDGPTPAYIVDAAATAYVGDSSDTFQGMHIPGEVILPTSPVLEQLVLVHSPMTASDVDAIREGLALPHFRGHVKYRDIFGDDHATTFSYAWRLSVPYGPRAILLGTWEKEQDDEAQAN